MCCLSLSSENKRVVALGGVCPCITKYPVLYYHQAGTSLGEAMVHLEAQTIGIVLYTLASSQYITMDFHKASPHKTYVD